MSHGLGLNIDAMALSPDGSAVALASILPKRPGTPTNDPNSQRTTFGVREVA